jgi:hypothetical protein
LSRRRARQGIATAPSEQPERFSHLLLRVSAFLDRYAIRIAIASVLLATLRIAATYPVFSHTIDEPSHIACGMEWLVRHTYRLESAHPPLARVAGALGPYLLGRRSHGPSGNYQEGDEILYSGDYQSCLTAARLGMLPFFWIAAASVYLFAFKSGGRAEAAAATVFFTLLPPVLAHAGVATNDMAVTAFVGAAFVAGLFLVEQPSLARGCALGSMLACAALSKLSALPFLPAVGAGALAWFVCNRATNRRDLWTLTKRLAIPACVALAVACVLIWAAYRFSFGPVGSSGLWRGLRLPAPEFFQGIQAVSAHNRAGHPSYLLGERSQTGFWYYYLVILPIKTPLPFLILVALGVVGVWTRRRLEPRRGLPLMFSLAIFAVALFSRINIGVRHILPVYLGFSLLAAFAALECMRRAAGRRWGAAIVATCVLWFLACSALAHPDYLAYCNFLAGDHPENVLADSDLDWGQDILRLGKRLQELGAPELTFNPFTIAHYDRLGFPPVKFGSAVRPSPGWNAVSITVWKVSRLGLYEKHPEIQLWPDLVKPDERVGHSILLYYFPYPKK